MAFSKHFWTRRQAGRNRLPEWTARIALSWLVLGTGAAHALPCGVPNEHSAIQDLCPVHEGMTRYMIGGAWGFMDKSGKLVGEPRFDEAEDFSEGLAAVKVGERWGFVNKAGEVVIAPTFDSVGNFSGGLAAATLSEGGKWGYIDRSGKWAIAPGYQWAGPFQADSAVVSESLDNSLVIDRRGQVLKRFEAGLKVELLPNAWGLYKAEREGARFLWRRGGERVPAPAQLASFVNDAGDGLWPAMQNKADGGGALWGAVDEQGRWQVPARFVELGAFKNGLAVARLPDPATKDEKADTAADDATPLSGLVDRQGEFVVPARYQHIDQQLWGGYVATYPGDGGVDIIGRDGKVLLPAATCRTLEQVSIPFPMEPEQWSVMQGCGQSWVFHAKAGMLHSGVAEPEAYVSATHLMLIHKPAESGQDENTGSADNAKRAHVQFDIFDTAGRRTFSSDDASMQGEQALGQYDDVFLVPSGNAPADAEQQNALPLALIIKGFKAIRVVTREGKVVTNPQWAYETQLLEYHYAHNSKPVEGPVVVSTETGLGAIDGRGQWVVPPKYRRLSPFEGGVAFALDGEQWVLIECNGKRHALPDDGWRFTRVAQGVYMGEASRGGDDDQFVRFDLATGQTTTVKMPGQVSLSGFHDGVAPAEAPGGQRWGLVNDRGEWIVPPRFDGQFSAIVDAQERLIGWRSTTYFRLDGSTESLHGWFSPQGQELAVPAYSAIDYDTEHGVLRLTKDSWFKGLMSPDGKLLLPAQYKDIQPTGGLYMLTEPTLYGLLDAHGEWSAPLATIDPSDLRDRPYQLTARGADRVLVDIRGRQSTASAPLALEGGKEEAPQWWWPHTEHAYHDNETTVFYGFDFKERTRIPGRVSTDATFSEGVITFTPRGAIDGGQLALADARGNVLGRYHYKEIGPMVEGFAMFKQIVPSQPAGRKSASKRSHDVEEEARIRMGYLDRQGKVAIAPRFERAQSFAEGRAVVVAKDNIGLIDTRGKLLVHSAWMCGRDPVILDAAGQVQWPAAAAKKKRC